VALQSHQAKFSSQENEALSTIEGAFRSAGFQPPSPTDVLSGVQMEGAAARGLLESLVKAKKLVRISEALIFHADVLTHIAKSLAVHKGRRFSVPEFKEWTGISRKFAIPLLEYLDAQHVTKREGDHRIVL
jgi:selenocysteine-specific elongation factor